eukprot:m.87355 g.87355  ORF g.87355 m.87355 type:complete len:252 (+) comp36541_c0_seq4:1277-2032(+)
MWFGTKLIAVFIIEKWCWQHLVSALETPACNMSLKLNIYLYMHALCLNWKCKTTRVSLMYRCMHFYVEYYGTLYLSVVVSDSSYAWCSGFSSQSLFLGDHLSLVDQKVNEKTGCACFSFSWQRDQEMKRLSEKFCFKLRELGDLLEIDGVSHVTSVTVKGFFDLSNYDIASEDSVISAKYCLGTQEQNGELPVYLLDVYGCYEKKQFTLTESLSREQRAVSLFLAITGGIQGWKCTLKNLKTDITVKIGKK